MSERPEGAGTGTSIGPPWGGWGPVGWTPWGKALWGTTIDFGNGARLVIDQAGIGRFTDASGETGTWDPTLLGWRDEDGTVLHPQFGIPGMELTAEQADAAIEQLVDAAAHIGLDEPDRAAAMEQRARDLWERWHGEEPYPY